MTESETSTKRWIGLAVVLMAIVGGGIWWRTSSAKHTDGSTTKDRVEADLAVKRGVAASTSEGVEAKTVRIDGSVVDRDGAAVSGAKVCARSRAGARLSLVEQRMSYCTFSDDSGRFSLENLRVSDYRVGASKAGLIPFTASFRARRPVGEALTLRLLPGGVLVRGTVFDLTGGVFSGAEVCEEDCVVPVESDADGSFELYTAPGVGYVVANAAGYAPAATEIVAPMDGAKIYMAPESSVFGTVVHEGTGEPVAGVAVKVSRETNYYHSTMSTGSYGSSLTDAEGRFEIDRLRDGRFSLSVEDEEVYGRHQGTAGLRLGQATGPIEIRVKAREGTEFEGRLVDAESGDAVEGCAFGLAPLNQAEPDPHGWVHTEVDGTFSGRFPPGEYRPSVDTRCPTHVMPGDVASLSLGASPVEGLTYALQRSGGIEGKVVDPSGEGFATSRVRAQSDERFVSSRTEPDGTFELTRLPAGTYAVVAESELAVSESEAVSLSLADGEHIGDVVIELERGLVVSGTLVDQTGDGIEGAVVSAVGEETRAATTVASGGFSVAGLPVGTYVLKASLEEGGTALRRPDGQDEVLGELEISAGRDPGSVRLVAERAKAEIRGDVIDDDGPVTDAYVVANREAGSGGAAVATTHSWGRRPVLTDVDGSFALTGLPTGKYTVRAYRPDGEESFVQHVDTGTSVSIEFETPATFSGVALDGKGRPLDEFTVRMVDAQGGGFRNERFLGNDGKFSIDGLRPGNWSVLLMVGRRSMQSEVELAAGEEKTNVELAMAKGVEVSGMVVDALSGEPVSGVSISASMGAAHAVTDDAGRFVLEDVPAGKTSVSARTGGWGEDGSHMTAYVTVTVPEAGLEMGELAMVRRTLASGKNPGDFGFDLEGSFQGSTKVASIREGGPAAQAGLPSSCEISVANGRRVLGNHQLLRAFLHVPSGTALTLQCSGDDEAYVLTAGPPR